MLVKTAFAILFGLFALMPMNMATSCDERDGTCAVLDEDTNVLLQAKLALEDADGANIGNYEDMELHEEAQAAYKEVYGKDADDMNRFDKGEIAFEEEMYGKDLEETEFGAEERAISGGAEDPISGGEDEDTTTPTPATTTTTEATTTTTALGSCLCGENRFLDGAKIPRWGSATCSAKQLSWSCKRPDSHKGKQYLKAHCCDDPNVGSCLCKGWKFLKGKEIQHWGGRTCSASETTWACRASESNGGRKYLKAQCCEDPDEGACLCGSASKWLKGKAIKHWGGRTCSASELVWACPRANSNGGKRYLKKQCCKD